MSLPSLVKTWGYDVNNVFTWANSEEGSQKLGFNLKESLVAAGWSVIASSDKVAVKNVGDGSPDLWTDYTKLIRESSSNHSWCAIYNATLDVTLLIDCLSSADYYYDFYIIEGSLNANGTTALRPTSVSGVEKFYSDIEVCPSRSLGGTQSAWQCLYSTDELSFRFILRGNGSSSGSFSFFIQRPSNVPDLWIDPVVFALVANAITDVMLTENLFYSAKATLFTLVNGVIFNMYISSESCSNGDAPASMLVGVNPGDLSTDNGHLLCPMGLIGNDVGIRGSNGRLDDMWWKPLTMTTGDTMPGNGDKTFICFGDFVFPWNGTAPVIS
jgi:hypothetical protein